MVKVSYRRSLELVRLASNAKKIAIAFLAIINLLAASRSGLFFPWRGSRWSRRVLQDVMGGCKALRGSLGYLRVQISGRASSKVKAVYSTRVNEERGARRKSRRQRTRRGRRKRREDPANGQ